MVPRLFHYRIVDVFTERVFGGNPLAVFLDGATLSDAEMQSIAKEMNLSETTFVLLPADRRNHFRVRIFTPARELPMAGHPTIGTAFVLARERMLPNCDIAGNLNVRLEEQIGVIPVRLEHASNTPGMIWMTQPRPQFGPRMNDTSVIAEVLGIPPHGIEPELPIEVVSCGVPFLIVPVRDLATMRRLKFRPDIARESLASLGTNEVLAFAREVEHPGSTVHSRMFAPELGVPEDPATGSATGPLGAYLVRHRLVQAEPTAAIVSEQGIEMGRPSFLHVRITQSSGEITQVEVGGRSVFVAAGELTLPA